jgi:hypothetical protein
VVRYKREKKRKERIELAIQPGYADMQKENIVRELGA